MNLIQRVLNLRPRRWRVVRTYLVPGTAGERTFTGPTFTRRKSAERHAAALTEMIKRMGHVPLDELKNRPYRVERTEPRSPLALAVSSTLLATSTPGPSTTTSDDWSVGSVIGFVIANKWTWPIVVAIFIIGMISTQDVLRRRR